MTTTDKIAAETNRLRVLLEKDGTSVTLALEAIKLFTESVEHTLETMEQAINEHEERIKRLEALLCI